MTVISWLPSGFFIVFMEQWLTLMGKTLLQLGVNNAFPAGS
jgi:hypothetical protein